MRRVAFKVALVTGGASGLGKAIAQLLAEEGATVIISDVQSELGMNTAKEGRFSYMKHDVREEARWTEIMYEIEQQFGRLDVLVNNAGIVGPLEGDSGNPETTSLSSWRAVFAVNVEGVFLGCKTAIALMTKGGGGSIINISSIAALQAVPMAIAYGASKAAVQNITRSVALHCAKNGSRIRCNSVHPGNVRTPLLEKAMAEIARSRGVAYEEVVQEFRTDSAQGEFTEADDIAEAVLFLASDAAKRITGIQLVVDGGSTLGKS
jgi:NAD(P)-dependent dehydrogenase (short-subunit alcohol dehydrogenase family)